MALRARRVKGRRSRKRFGRVANRTNRRNVNPRFMRGGYRL